MEPSDPVLGQGDLNPLGPAAHHDNVLDLPPIPRTAPPPHEDAPDGEGSDADVVSLSGPTEHAGMFDGYRILPGFATMPDGTTLPSLRFTFAFTDAATGQLTETPPITLILDRKEMRKLPRNVEKMSGHALRAAARGFIPKVIR